MHITDNLTHIMLSCCIFLLLLYNILLSLFVLNIYFYIYWSVDIHYYDVSLAIFAITLPIFLDPQFVFYYISAGYEYKTEAELKELDGEEDECMRTSLASVTRMSLNAPT